MTDVIHLAVLGLGCCWTRKHSGVELFFESLPCCWLLHRYLQLGVQSGELFCLYIDLQ